MLKVRKKLWFSLLLSILFCFSICISSCFADTWQGEYPDDPFDAYESNLHGITGPAKFVIWDAPLFYSENYTRIMKWDVEVNCGDLGNAYMSFYTNPFSFVWNRACYKTDPDTGEEERYLAPIGGYRATITAIGGEAREIQAQRDVEVIIPDPEKFAYEDRPDVYWPKTGLMPSLENMSEADILALLSKLQ